MTSRRPPRVLIVQPSLQPPGGGNSICVWTIEALRRDYALTLLTWEPPDLAEANRYYGTSLRSEDFAWLGVSARLRGVVNALPVPGAHLRRSFLLRACKRLRGPFDVMLTANNEADFGRPGIQYVHFPWAYWPRPQADLRWYHPTPLLLLYYRLAAGIAGFSAQAAARNLTLTNSDWTAARMRERYAVEAATVYPPVPGDFPPVPWEERDEAFISVGRLAPEKELEKLIGIVERLREQGFPGHLTLIGSGGPSRYRARLLRAIAGRPWVRLHENLPREEVVRRLAQHRFGLHGMREEHFGIAVAEMVRAGCIPFVPAGGGQVEIVAADPHLLYGSEADAVEKIRTVLHSPAQQAELRSFLAARGELFSVDRFTRTMRRVVAEFLSREAAA